MPNNLRGEPTPTREHDLILIGTGSANTIPNPALDDLDIAIVEHGPFGGTCVNVGCIPTKMFVYPADLVQQVVHARELGVSGSVSVDWASVRDRVFSRVDAIAESGRAYRESQPNVTVYAGHGRFTGPHTLTVDLDDGQRASISADRIVIAAGGRVRGLDVDGLRTADPGTGVHTSDTVMRLESLPKRMAIVGGGFVAAEFAHVLHSCGVEVTWLHRGPRLLSREDASVSVAFTDLAANRYDLQLHTEIQSATWAHSVWNLDVTGPLGKRSLQVDAVLLATGRINNADLLDVAAADLAQHPDGRVLVDRYQRTSQPGIFALGDISSEFQLKHVANHEAKVVAHNLAVEFGRANDLIASDHRFVPHAVFTWPQIASFGQTEDQLVASGTPYVSNTHAFADVAYGWAMEDSEGFVRVYAAQDSRQILGAHIMGYQASSLIQPLIQAASFDQSADDVARGQYWIHPALSEVVENALLGLPTTAG